MSEHSHDDHHGCQAHCCPVTPDESRGITRRGFLGASALGGIALSGLSWSSLAAAQTEIPVPCGRKPLKVKPVLVYSTPQRREKCSWRNWGGIETQEQADEEVVRIQGELDKVRKAADFPVEFLPVSARRGSAELDAGELETVDALIVYAAGGGMGALNQLSGLGKDVIFFCRHKSGPVYLWYEIISPRYLRQHTDTLAVEGIDEEDVVVDSLDELTWRLRALCGLKNTMEARIVALGGAAGWATPKAPELARERFKLDIREVPYKPDLADLITAARADEKAVARSKKRADAYLALPGTKLETKREYVDNAFLLDEVFRRLMAEADCRMFTINSCMGTIMPIAETTACLPLSTLNDDGYLAFCESDFVVVPSGILLANISGLPVFLNDPTYPHDGVITLAHCTGPRKMDGKKIEAARILTHFESDYGAAPKVEMPKGQQVTNIVPAFKADRWVGLLGEIVDAPFLPICRDQIDIRFKPDSLTVAQRMPGFHWMTGYGDYTRELGYALKRVGIAWEFLG